MRNASTQKVRNNAELKDEQSHLEEIRNLPAHHFTHFSFYCKKDNLLFPRLRSASLFGWNFCLFCYLTFKNFFYRNAEMFLFLF